MLDVHYILMFKSRSSGMKLYESLAKFLKKKKKTNKIETENKG